MMLADSLSVISIDDAASISVVDNKFRILFSNAANSSSYISSTYPGIQTALKGKSDIQYLQTDEGEHVIATSAVPSVGWALLIEESWEDIASPLLRVTQYAPIILIPILGLSLLALWFGLRKIVQPMQSLEVKAQELAAGDFVSITKPVGGVPEIRHLQETLSGMAGRLQEAQNNLHGYVGAITESVEKERRNLARELHDDTLQTFIALGQYTQFALHWNKDPKVEKSLSQVLSLVDQGGKNSA